MGGYLCKMESEFLQSHPTTSFKTRVLKLMKPSEKSNTDNGDINSPIQGNDTSTTSTGQLAFFKCR